ncbi:hypothetical protein TBLA_0J00310 [Henningerozyma blattae CBS 6284]|uniref:Histone demethylase JHD2 n=1 Tax=Henningerozyma blattae (strain ATCC 34711 / CBS 6284 / DSM 70876 / NBRC 10599 / NRRL Y-10934 / UCD 77-7) TaxID=1071380 RepID=I2H9H9_HENB6|nr:hypothetical protein TBLA_0J00310 [Tetrapisispora blattae CBS 6284]CCH63031.1 hypothetical protein TBLA_0J00310 [Tetrapisispora blattae CBS 6284]
MASHKISDETTKESAFLTHSNLLQPIPTKRHMEEIPVFYPTEEEFNNPLHFIASDKVQQKGNKYGMIKIVPPKSFNPKLNIDKKSFKFDVRLQNLFELDLLNRSRLMFAKQLDIYHRSLPHQPDTKISIDSKVIIKESKKTIYLYNLYVSLIKLNNLHLRTHPSDLDPNKSLKLFDPKLLRKSNPESKIIWEELSQQFNCKPTELYNVYLDHLSSFYNHIYGLTNGILNKDCLVFDEYPKSLLSDSEDSEGEASEDSSDENTNPCLVCLKNNKPSRLLLCDFCNKPYHTFCLSPPIEIIPKGEWFCNNCIIGNGFYGFKHEKSQVSLQDFQAEALQFQKQYNPKDLNQLEKEFWDLISASPNDLKSQKDITQFITKYGADIHDENVLTGFPTLDHVPSNLSSAEYKSFLRYCTHPMNLKNLPFADGSLLSLTKSIQSTQNDKDVYSNISGVTIPWLYAGSLFSTFCWHLEDQYTLSINYQHEGAPKIWYSIPDYECDKFKKLLFNLTPDYFIKQPDLLSQLITQISPYSDIFKDSGIKCFKAIQHPNEYIITLPKCFHAGFNSGFNINEAVNFTLPTWLPYGFQSIKDYKLIKKDCILDIIGFLIDVLSNFDSLSNQKLDIDESFIKNCFNYFLKYYNLEKSRISKLPFSLLNKQYLLVSSPPTSATKESKNNESNSNKCLHSRPNQEIINEILCKECKTICSLAFIAHSKSDQTIKRRKITTNRFLTSSRNFEIYCLEDYIKKFIQHTIGLGDQIQHPISTNKKRNPIEIPEISTHRDDLILVRDWDKLNSLISDISSSVRSI